MNKLYLNRINFEGEFRDLINELLLSYNISELQDFSIIEAGFEDLNILINTKTKKYVAKFFASDRSQIEIQRFIEIMSHVSNTEINHPFIYKNKNNSFLFENSTKTQYAILMDYIEGKSFKELDEVPNEVDLKNIILQAVLINKIQYKPKYINDSWAIPNILNMYNRVKNYLTSEDTKLIKKVLSKFSQIPINELPHCFVHGDLIKTNVIKGVDKNIYIVDFSVSNWYPRIQEVAVISGNLMIDLKNEDKIQDRLEKVVKLYDDMNPLMNLEKKYLYDYTLCCVAMELMGGHFEKFINNEVSEELDFWIELGRKGLTREL